MASFGTHTRYISHDISWWLFNTHARTHKPTDIRSFRTYIRFGTLLFPFVSFHFISILFGPSTMKWEIKQKKHPCEHETLLKVHEKRNTLKWKYLWKARNENEHKREASGEKGIFCSIFILFSWCHAICTLCKMYYIGIEKQNSRRIRNAHVHTRTHTSSLHSVQHNNMSLSLGICNGLFRITDCT